MAYKPNRQESEDVIRQLAERYPKCFFEEPKLRRPLKRDIVADIQKDGMPLAYELINAGVLWYQSHFSYLYGLQTGAKRIDLNGREVGTVTEREYITAQDKIKAAGQQRKSDATETLRGLHAIGRITDDQIKKLDAMKTKATDTIAPELTRLHEAVVAANTLLVGPGDSLHSAMAIAALGIVCKEAQRLIDSLKEQQAE